MKTTSIVFTAWMTLLLAGCGPQDARAGFSLGGVEAPIPADWRFTDDVREIAIQVHTPYLIPHAVTIWCAQVDGRLYLGANAPQTKHWPGWVDQDPDVRLRIGEQVFMVRLVPQDDPNVVAGVRAAYTTKYQLEGRDGEAVPDVRYWQVTARAEAAS